MTRFLLQSLDSVARFNYHFAGYAEESGCYITTFIDDNHSHTLCLIVYQFDPNHPVPEKQLYCLISFDRANDSNLNVVFYDNSSAVKEVAVSPSDLPYISLSRTIGLERRGSSVLGVRIQPSYYQVKLLNSPQRPQDKLERFIFSDFFEHGFDFPVDSTHHYSISPGTP